ncbi:MAG TPA: hypothetical protein VMT82_09795 [candidate division Zixibacteria bacterium]|nr:hypothetical protein [candidate division Zixibacteria bacterium]
MILRAAKRSARARAMLREEEFTFQIVTTSGIGGHFVLHNGQLDLHWGRHQKPDFAQIWRSGGDAVRTLTSRDETAMLRGFEEGLYRMQGRFAVALWFNEMMKLARNPDAC